MDKNELIKLKVKIMKLNFIGTKPFKDTDSGTTSTPATASGSPSGGERMIITDIAGSTGTIGAKIVVKDGSTTIWEMAIPVASSTTPYGIAISFDTPLVGTINTKVHIEVGGKSSTPSGAYANIVGYSSKN